MKMPQNIHNLRMISFYGPAWDLIGLPAVKVKPISRSDNKNSPSPDRFAVGEMSPVVGTL